MAVAILHQLEAIKVGCKKAGGAQAQYSQRALYNIAQCHQKLGHVDEALTFYKTYLRRAPDALNRSEVERRIQDLEVEQRRRRVDDAAAGPDAEFG